MAVYIVNGTKKTWFARTYGKRRFSLILNEK